MKKIKPSSGNLFFYGFITLTIFFVGISLYLFINLKNTNSQICNELEKQLLKETLTAKTKKWNLYLQKRQNKLIKKDLDNFLNTDSYHNIGQYQIIKTDLLELQEILAHDNNSSEIELQIYLKVNEIKKTLGLIIHDKYASSSNLKNNLRQNKKNMANYFISCCFFAVVLFALLYIFYLEQNKLRKLNYSQELYLNNSIDCIIMSDAENRIIEFNLAAEKVFGYKREEVLNKDAILLHASLTDSLRIENSMKNTGKYSGEVLNRDRNNRHFLSYLSANVIFDLNGKMLGAMGISRDITDQKRNESNFKQLVDDAKDFIFMTDVDGNFTYLNDAVKEVTGYEREELLNIKYTILVSDDEKINIQDFYTNLFLDRTKQSYKEMKLRQKDGNFIWVGQLVQLIPNQLNSKHVQGFHCIIRNINNSKINELRLAESEKRYSDMFEQSKDYIHSTDQSGQLKSANESWKNAFNYSEAEIENMSLFDIVSSESLDLVNDVIRQINLNTPNINDFEICILDKEKNKHNLDCSINTTLKEGKIEFIHFFLRPKIN